MVKEPQGAIFLAMVDNLTHEGSQHDVSPPLTKSALALREEVVLAFWNREHIFEKSLKKDAPKGDFVFYDGPPFATGLPHFGHLLQSALKDAIPRYRTMQGYRVPRQWGWDCHGLPLENQIEQELGFKNKRDIEAYGIQNFNNAAKGTVLRYADEWRSIIPRMGRWADMDHDYKTMDATYTESVWWAFKNLYDRGLAYEGFKAMHLCPRCGTTLSNFEVAQAYQDIPDIAVTVKLPLLDEPNTSLLIWTTTSWTLPGNSAAAVNAEATYVKVQSGNEFVIVAKNLAARVLGTEDYTIVSEMLGQDLVGRAYEPPFSYFKDQVHTHKTHAWKVYAAAYVTLDDGTGIVHLAPAYGAEDLELAQKEKIPLIHHVTDDGRFISTVTDFAHVPVKPKGRHMETDEKIVHYLEAHGLLFKKEKITHSYPHCWRCDTPLLNWAANSWFVNVQKIKPKLLEENSEVRWVPEHVGKGRFKNLLESAPDWAISRSRYWGAPLPVWRNTKTKELKVIGSVEELLCLVRKSGNRYFVMRHGEARSNVEGFVNSSNDIKNNLTPLGEAQVSASAQKLKFAHIDTIFASPLTRTQETARILCDELNLPYTAIVTDTRVSETHFGEKNDKPIEEWRGLFANLSDKFNSSAVGGESYSQVLARVGDFLFDIESRLQGKNILIVTHGAPAWLMEKVAMHSPHHKHEKELLLANADFKEITFTAYPHNEHFELDLHRPYIDDVLLSHTQDGEWKRVVDVFDCWFESGSMPYASHHYPFKTDVFNPKGTLGFFAKGYPADFIAESIDQTRGWFYSLIVLGTALFGKSPYKAVVTNGLILAEDGRKMSKKLKNYPDPMELIEKFGADALRHYLLSSSVIRGEDLRFSARGVEDVVKKLLMRLDNVRSFYELYASNVDLQEISSEKVLGSPVMDAGRPSGPDYFLQKLPEALEGRGHVLDRWILSRLGELHRDTTKGFEAYELDVATRPLGGFIHDLSTWYLRRSRDRFKQDKNEEGSEKEAALRTLRYVLFVLSHTIAPVMPFFAEDLYQRVKSPLDPESVHLALWPAHIDIDEQLLTDMERIRELASVGLQEREKAGIKIRQPLSLLTVKVLPANPDLRIILKEEVNVKDVVEDATILGDLVLDTTLTPELKEEGQVRDIIRAIQDLRKTQKLTISDRPILLVNTNEEGKVFFEHYRDTLVDETNLLKLVVTADSIAELTFALFPLELTLTA